MKPYLRAVLGKFARRAIRVLPHNETLRRLIKEDENRIGFTALEWHERMLADAVRVQSYRKGISSAVKPGDTVIDLGTGTGILAMFAAAAGARQVHAIDHSDFIRVAEEIARRNGFDNIHFTQKNSRDFAPPEPVDLIIHEQMGHTIFGEQMIRNLLDLKRRALKPGGRILPARFELFAAPVALKPDYRRPFLWDIDGTGIELSFLKDHADLQPYRIPAHERRLLKCLEIEAFLAPPASLLAFDMNRIEGEGSLAARHTVTWKIDRSGVLDGICFYFRTEFEDGTSFDTSPFSPQTNWENVLLRTAPIALAAGSEFTQTLILEPLTDWKRWSIDKGTTASAQTSTGGLVGRAGLEPATKGL